MTGIDVDGIDLAAGDESRRVFFPSPLKDARDLRMVLVELAKEAARRHLRHRCKFAQLCIFAS